MMNKMSGMLISMAVLLLIGGCATQQAKIVVASGFLKDYSLLREGKGIEPQLFFRNPKADLSAYTRILIEPITLWQPVGSDLEDLDEEDVQHLCGFLYKTFKERLEKDFELVKEPGPKVMRLRLAITEAESSIAALNKVTSIVPIGIAVSGIKRLATGTTTFVGKASLEAEFTDSMSGDLLLAGVDRRAGTKSPAAGWTSWDHVEKAFDYWAEEIYTYLHEARGLK